MHLKLLFDSLLVYLLHVAIAFEKCYQRYEDKEINGESVK